MKINSEKHSVIKGIAGFLTLLSFSYHSGFNLKLHTEVYLWLQHFSHDGKPEAVEIPALTDSEEGSLWQSQ